MEKNDIRKMAVMLLDDNNGIDVGAYEILRGLLTESGNEDMINEIMISEDRAYIGEDTAIEILDLIKVDESLGMADVDDDEEEIKFPDDLFQCDKCDMVADIEDSIKRDGVYLCPKCAEVADD